LAAARRIFRRLRGGFQIVTLAGEVLRSSGSVTGGQRRTQVQGQVLAREREWRRLPGQIRAAEERGQQIETSLAEAQSAEEQVREQVAALDVQRLNLEEALAASRAQRRDVEREAEHVAQQIAFREELVAKLDHEADELEAQGSSLEADLRRFETERGSVEGQLAAVQARLDGLHGEDLYEELAQARTAAAVARGAWDHHRAVLDSLRQGREQLRDQIRAKRQRIGELEEEQSSLAVQIDGQKTHEAVIHGWLASLAKRIEPAEVEMARLESEREALEEDETTLRARLRHAESRHAQAQLSQSRQEDRLQRLRQQIMDDFGLVDMEPVEGVPEQPPLPLGELVSTLPLVERLPDGLEQEIHQIKAQLRRMGSINPNAPEEYAETLDRYSFLTSQATDLDEAANGLREVIAELDEVMRQGFQATFKEVARRFADNFTQLFGGGAARLVLTEPGDISRTGVDIVARPPGRRQQTLALLSGGERSLTAVALIFALLEVSAPPFCVLDEVDAMLDEVNVRRFRQALEGLAERTQFIVITHNRRTIEAAATIYGVSMGDDSVSQVVSLRLEGDRIAAPDGSSMEVLKEA
jgi:chromosome segregation protein